MKRKDLSTALLAAWLLGMCVAGCGGSGSGGGFPTQPGTTLPGTAPGGTSGGAGGGAPAGGGTNAPSAPPPVSDQRVLLTGTPLPLAEGETLTLDATADDPNSQVQWTAVSGPGQVQFSAPDALSTQATFTAPGVYVVRVDATAGTGAKGWAELEVEVNQAPALAVKAAAATPTNLRLALQAQLSDDGLPRQSVGLSYVTDVAPILANRCAACHAGGRPEAQAAFPLSDPADPQLDYAQVVARVDLQDPAASLLLLKPQNDPSVPAHGGGEVLAPSSTELAVLRSWIEQGAIDQPPAAAFDTEIYPLLRDTCAACHANGAGGLTINADPSATYDQVLSRVDLANPAGSLLLQKPAADGVQHGGSADPLPGFELGSANYGLLLQWVTDGAPRSKSAGQPQPALVSFHWELMDGPASVVFGDATAQETQIAFAAPGTYTLRAVASDGHLTSEQLLTVEATAPQQLASFPASTFLVRYPDDEETAEAYYQTIDPRGERRTFDDWLRVNGFDQGPAEQAVYYNRGDLNFGRRMIMQRLPGGGVAYSTTNYANLNDATADRNRIASVTMEFAPGPNGGPAFTKFFVYDGNGDRITAADLDGGGAKYVPGLCIMCHGGTQGTVQNGVYSNGGDIGARFLPFDLNAFDFRNRDGFRRQDQEDDFRELNRHVLDTQPSAATLELIQGWYGGANLPLPTQQSDFVPQGWAGHEELYLGVVAKSCRTCHVRFDAPLDFASFNGLVGYGAELAKELDERTMPDSRVTFENFWSTEQPALLKAALNMPAEPVPLGVPPSATLVERVSATDDGRLLDVHGDFYELALAADTNLQTLTDQVQAKLTEVRQRRDRLRNQGSDIRRLDRTQTDAAANTLDQRAQTLRRRRDQLRQLAGQEAALANDLGQMASDLARLTDRNAPRLAPGGVFVPLRANSDLETRIQDTLTRLDDLRRGQPDRVRTVLRALRTLRQAENPAFPQQ